jgi:hypothetical protein
MKLVDQTDNLLGELKLHGIRAELARRLRQAQDESLGHEDLLNLLLCGTSSQCPTWCPSASLR